jgi:diacylglycerol kinase (ATP)
LFALKEHATIGLKNSSLELVYMTSPALYGSPLVILNPAANRGNMSLYRTVIEQRLRLETSTRYVETQRAGEATELARQAALRNQAVIVVGGDGSVNEVINGILRAGRCVPLGVVPAGSGNDFARNVLLMSGTVNEVVERAFNGPLKHVDAGMVNGQYFANGCSVGLDADVASVAATLRKMPFMSGTRLYYVAALYQLLFRYQDCPWLKFSINDLSADDHFKRYVLIAVTIGPAYGAGFRINPTADPGDGLFDICAVDYLPLLRTLQLFPGVKEGKHIGVPGVSFHRAQSVMIESNRPMIIQIDGEITQSTTFRASILPRALLVRS